MEQSNGKNRHRQSKEQASFFGGCHFATRDNVGFFIDILMRFSFISGTGKPTVSSGLPLNMVFLP